jgi:hypothetical protein
MDTFNFPYHVPTHTYPKGVSFQFGKGYEFGSAPQLPLQRRFKLSFNTMMWYFNQTTGAVDASFEPTTNMKLLIDFYEAHIGVKFIYPHPLYGNLTVRFASDIGWEVPKGMPGGSGAVEPFEIILVEQP